MAVIIPKNKLGITMTTQLIIGTFVITLSIIVEVIFIYLAVLFMRSGESKATVLSLPIMLSYLTWTTLWMLLAFSIVAWIWAGTLVLVGAMTDLEESLYFSMVTFTTLGFGDVVLKQDWRILSGLMAANGLVLFGLNTAIIVETLRGILNAVDKHEKKG